MTPLGEIVIPPCRNRNCIHNQDPNQVTPLGRILNRFSKDISAVGGTLLMMICWTLPTLSLGGRDPADPSLTYPQVDMTLLMMICWTLITLNSVFSAALGVMMASKA